MSPSMAMPAEPGQQVALALRPAVGLVDQDRPAVPLGGLHDQAGQFREVRGGQVRHGQRDHPGAAAAQLASGQVGHVAQRLDRRLHPGPGRRSNVDISVHHVGNRFDRHARSCGNVLEARRHGFALYNVAVLTADHPGELSSGHCGPRPGYRDRMPISAACLPVQEPAIRVESDVDAAVTLMTVLGGWAQALADAAALALHKCLADHPEALIVDLSGLSDPRTESASVWIGAQRAAARLNPPLELALCVPPDLPLADRLQRLGSREHLPVYARVRQARVAIAGRLPAGDRMCVAVAPEPEAPSLARNLVGDACRAWRLHELLHPARLVMSELVTNAVEHAGTDLTAVVTRRGSGLQLAVADGSAEHPRLIKMRPPRRGCPLDERGRGLRTVAATATAWGSLPTPLGKVVWANLQPTLEQKPPAVPRRRHPNAAAPHR
jgi:hypothetical protein